MEIQNPFHDPAALARYMRATSISIPTHAARPTKAPAIPAPAVETKEQQVERIAQRILNAGRPAGVRT